MRPVAIAIVALLSGSAIAQCENGQCRQPARAAFRSVGQVIQAQPVRVASRAAFQSVQSVRQSSGCTGSSQSYGSTGSGYSMGSSGSAVVSYGSSGSAVVSATGIKQRRSSRAAIIAAAEQAHAACTIDSQQLQAIKLASRSPRMLSRMEDLILTQAQASGAYSLPMDANGEVVSALVDWDGIAEFITKLMPLILKLIEMFA
jgi:hypothetical protein